MVERQRKTTPWCAPKRTSRRTPPSKSRQASEGLVSMMEEGGDTFPIVGTGTLRLSLRSGEGVVCVTLMNVAHVPGLSHHFLSLRRIADAGNKYIGTREGIRIVFAKSGDELLAPLYGAVKWSFWPPH